MANEEHGEAREESVTRHSSFVITLLPGDGIGPEVVGAACGVLDAVAARFGHSFTYREGLIGGAAIDATGDPLPAATLDLCRESDAVLLGAVGGPKWDNPGAPVRPEQGLLRLRQALGLFANLRPVRPLAALAGASPLRAEVVAGVDLLVVRELTGGLYFGKPSRRWATARGRRAVDTLPYREEEVARVVRLACALADERRGLVSSVDKANVLNTSRLWREVATEVAAEYPAVRLEHVLVDACAMYLVSDPRRFDVVVTENMFGDILTDEASVLAGSLGVLPSASLSGRPPARQNSPARQFGLYEPIHGSAPDIAGRDRANPLGAILSSAMLLRLTGGLEREAAAIEHAVDAALAAGLRTADIAAPGCEPVGTRAMGEAVAKHMSAES
ncbi:MAG TPA: 3-isopropylmalate dehydrogenase [Thermomicrobiales bacterium]|nr:3-isopropylmalate dehydrogenase [Thermomicrobiales bacterium]